MSDICLYCNSEDKHNHDLCQHMHQRGYQRVPKSFVGLMPYMILMVQDNSKKPKEKFMHFVYKWLLTLRMSHSVFVVRNRGRYNEPEYKLFKEVENIYKLSKLMTTNEHIVLDALIRLKGFSALNDMLKLLEARGISAS